MQTTTTATTILIIKINISITMDDDWYFDDDDDDGDEGNKHGSAMICLSPPFSQLRDTGAYHYLYSDLIGYQPSSEWVEN